MIEEHKGYHHEISSKEAEKRLRRKGGHCYLTRYSNTHSCYILSTLQSRPTPTIRHYRIEKDKQKYRIKGKTLTFDGINELLTYYEENSIDPALINIGSKYTEEDYTKSQGCCCLIL